MSGAIVRFPMNRVVELRYFQGSHSGCDDGQRDPELGELQQAYRSVVAAIDTLDRQRRSILFRHGQSGAAARLKENSGAAGSGIRRASGELARFIDRMQVKFPGVDDEHLLRWTDNGGPVPA